MGYDKRNFRCIDHGGGQTVPCRTFKYYTTDNLQSAVLYTTNYTYFQDAYKDHPNIATHDTIIAVNDTTQVVSIFQVSYVSNTWQTIDVKRMI